MNVRIYNSCDNTFQLFYIIQSVAQRSGMSVGRPLVPHFQKGNSAVQSTLLDSWNYRAKWPSSPISRLPVVSSMYHSCQTIVWASFYNCSRYQSYLEGLLKLRLLSFKTSVSDSIGLEGSWEFSPLKCSQVMVMLLVWGPHFWELLI